MVRYPAAGPSAALSNWTLFGAQRTLASRPPVDLWAHGLVEFNNQRRGRARQLLRRGRPVTSTKTSIYCPAMTKSVGFLIVALRFIAWILVLVITALSLVPPELRPETSAPHVLEHAAIFAATGAAFGFGYNERSYRTLVGLIIFAALIELAQLAAPGRHARLGDFVIDAVASCASAALATMIVARMSEWRT